MSSRAGWGGGGMLAGALCAALVVSAEEGHERGWGGGLDYCVEVMLNADGGLATGAITAGLVNLKLDYQGEKMHVHANLLGPHGGGLTAEKVGDFSVISNIDTVDDPRLQELWSEVALRDASSLRLGMLAADTEFWGTEYGGLFINSVFGAPTHVSGNLPGPSIFPVATLGLRWDMEFASGTVLRAAVLDGDAGDPEGDNHYGLGVKLDEGALILFEVQDDRGNRFGGTNTIRLGAFVHSGHFQGEDGEVERGNWGLLAVVDQALTQRLGWFGRLTLANAVRSRAPFSVETGINLHEFMGSSGTFGVGLAYVELNGRLAALDEPALAHLTRELILELTFEAPLGKHFALQPDLQYIVSPGGDEEVDDALVVGLRGKLSLAL